MTIFTALPFTLTNGTTADATQVMADFNQIVNDGNTNAAHSGANSDITSLTGLTTPISYAQGGTGTTTSTPITPWAVAAGTADAITATYSPAVAALFDGLSLGFRASAANATTTPTFAPNGLTAHTITKFGGTALAASDIPGSLAECLVRYNSANTRWELIDPAPPSSVVASIADATNGGLNFSAATGAVQANIKPADLLTKASPTTADLILIGDAAASSAAKTSTVAQVLALSTPVWNSMAGFLPSSIAGTSTTATLTVSAGQAADSTNVATLTKATTSSWAVANGNAALGYQGGTTLPNSSTIHFFVCFGASGTTIFANNGTTPTAPSGYTTYFRRIFSLKTNSSGALIPGTAIEGSGGGLVFWLTTQTLDANATTIITASRTLITLNVPGGIKVQPFVRALGGGTNNELLLMSGDETDIAPTISTMAVPLYDMGISQLGATGSTASPPFLTTNTSAQIAARASQGTASTIGIVTRGWSDFRRG